MNLGENIHKLGLNKLFMSETDLNFFNDISNQLLQHVVGQYVYYLEIDPAMSESNIYGESREKIFKSKKVTICRIELMEPEGIQDAYGMEVKKTIELNFSKDLLERQEINVRAGDYIETVDGGLWEIVGRTEPTPIYGDLNEMFSVKCTAILRE